MDDESQPASPPIPAPLPPPGSPVDPVPPPPVAEPPGITPTTGSEGIPPAPSEIPPAPSEAPATRRHRGRRLALIIAAAVAILAIGGVAVGLFMLRGSSDVLTEMVPADVDAYATVYLDPALQQKLNLRNLSRKFPALTKAGDLNKLIDDAMNSLLESSGLTFTQDVKPWLSSQMAVTTRSKASQGAVLIASKDDQAAKAALAKVRKASQGETWADQTYRGVTISVGSFGGEPSDAHAIVDHTVVLGDLDMIKAIIDADQGNRPNLTTSTAYQDTLALLPGDHLAVAYIDLAPLIKDALASLPPDLPGSFGQLNAYTTLGAAFTAQSTGIETSIVVRLDPSKLTKAQASNLALPAKRNAMLDWMPGRAFVIEVSRGFRETAQAVVDQASKDDPDFAKSAEDVGLTGPDGAIAHLTGEIGLEVGPGDGTTPGGAFLAGTDDVAGAKTFLDKLAEMIAPSQLGESQSAWHRETYRDVTIAWLEDPFLSSAGLAPAYAATDGAVIIATTPDEMKAILDAHGTGQTVASTPNFTAATGNGEASASGLIYVDIEGLVAAIRDQLSSDDLQSFDTDTAPNLAPMKTFVLASNSTTRQVTIRMFLRIE